MDLLIPGEGLIIWQALGFLALLFVLSKFAWRPILDTLKQREESIEEALKSAEAAKEEMAKMQATNEKLLHEARLERDKMIKDATDAAKKLKEEAKEEASAQADKIIADAKAAIEVEKNAALKDLTNLVAEYSLQIAEKLVRKNYASDKDQQALVQEFMKDTKLN